MRLRRTREVVSSGADIFGLSEMVLESGRHPGRCLAAL
jgi:hypothetical protein